MKIGCDIVYIPRFQKILARTTTMRGRIFLPQEKKGASLEKLAGIFAAKEAVIKVSGLKAGDWLKIEISKDKNGRPRVTLANPPKNIINQDLSISHDKDYALACAVFLFRPNK